MARLPDPSENLTPQARKLYDHLKAERGHIEGMYGALMNHPELTEVVSALGGYLRFGHSRLPADVRELAILWVGRRAGAAYEWVQHEPYAQKAGVPQKVIDDLRAGREPAGLTTLQENVLAALQYVQDKKSIPSDLQDKLVGELGVEGLIELVVLHGYYHLIAGVIFAFDVPLPIGSSDPFRD